MAAKPDVLVACSIRFEDLVAITRKLKELDLNIRMVSAVPYGLLPDYYKQLGKDAEFVYSGSFWDAALPYPGNQQFVAAYEKEFNHPPAVQSAGGYVRWSRFTGQFGGKAKMDFRFDYAASFSSFSCVA